MGGGEVALALQCRLLESSVGGTWQGFSTLVSALEPGPLEESSRATAAIGPRLRCVSFPRHRPAYRGSSSVTHSSRLHGFTTITRSRNRSQDVALKSRRAVRPSGSRASPTSCRRCTRSPCARLLLQETSSSFPLASEPCERQFALAGVLNVELLADGRSYGASHWPRAFSQASAALCPGVARGNALVEVGMGPSEADEAKTMLR
jgi:hypothetical protein